MCKGATISNFYKYFIYFSLLFISLNNFLKFYINQRKFGENLIKIGLISSTHWRFLQRMLANVSCNLKSPSLQHLSLQSSVLPPKVPESPVRQYTEVVQEVKFLHGI